MEDSREGYWKDVSQYREDKSKIHALVWDVYTRQKEELINRVFLVSVPCPKGGNMVWNFLKDNIIKEKDQYEYIGLHGFGYTFFEEEEGGVI